MVAESQTSVDVLNSDNEKIQKELESLILERQWMITQTRKGTISENDMEYQLGALGLQELTLKRELASLGNTTKIYLMDDWETKVEEYLQDLKAGIDSLNSEPENQEDRQEIFRIKRHIVTTLVRRVTIDRNRELHVEINLTFV